MSTLTITEQRQILTGLGWRIRTTGELRQAVTHFQRAWRLGTRLEVDGVVGPRTSAALATSASRRSLGKPTASEHFSFSEFACKCGGRYNDCPRIWPLGDLIASLEALRADVYPSGLTIVSGCRCQGHNAAVKGAKDSQHMYGSAADITPKASLAHVRDLHLFAGLGFNPRQQVRHVDRRDRSGHNTTGGTPQRPTSWRYNT